ncbi:exopolyphosphatase / guanosine-5'-triphosphate,3'-diphosphate pyrophosphatase [Candidatus Kryptonium thompsonii]|nr:exopolyphosphatase / guanosine-5'-triphosphate,3'-diphosphate pyrophosphatase [Candidatus Kryptonium thompsoni]
MQKTGINLLNLYIKKTGIKIRVISGEEEARLTYFGAVSGLDHKILNSKITVIDIGGGSTEIINGLGFEIKNLASLNIGTVRITEKFFKHFPPLEEEIKYARDFINNEFEKINDKFDFADSTLVGVAATVTTIAAYDLRLETYDGEKVNMHEMRFETIDEIYNKFKKLSIDEIKKIPQISKGREDVIFAGILILRDFMKKFKFDRIIASDRGVRYGAILELQRIKF